MASEPAAIFLDIMLPDMRGIFSTVPVTSLKAYSFLSAGVRLSVWLISTILLVFANLRASASVISILKPGMDSNLSRVPPEKPRPLPLIFTTGTPQLATSGARISVVVSATPPVECLSTFIPSTEDKSKLSPEFAIAIVKSDVSSLSKF